MAVAIDSANNGTQATTSTTMTWSHTCTGSNLMLVVFIAGMTDTAPSVKYNNVSMTHQDTVLDGSTGIYVFTLANPSTGANNVVMTAGANSRYAGNSVSLTGATLGTISKSGPSGASNPSFTAVTSSTGSGFVVDGLKGRDGASSSAGAGQTRYSIQEYFNSGSNACLNASYEAFSSGNDVTMSWTHGLDTWIWIGVELKEPIVGPANLKSINGLAKASIKNINGLAIASVKNINGLA